MTNRFEKLLKEDQPTKRVPKKPQVVKATLPQNHKLATVSVRIPENSYGLLKIISQATNSKQVHVLEKAIQLYFDTVSLENPKVNALKALQDDYKVPDLHQTTIDEFL